MKKFMSMLLTLMVIVSFWATALASTVRTTGNVWLRTGPGLKYGKIRSVSKGTKLEYLGKSSVDKRGVRWYRVKLGGTKGWVSSRYSKLSSSSSSSSSSSKKTSTTKKTTTKKTTTKKTTTTTTKKSTTTSTTTKTAATVEPTTEVETETTQDALLSTGAVEPEATTDVPTFSTTPEPVELSNWYLVNLEDAATALSLGGYKYDETSDQPTSYYNEVLTISGDKTVQHFRVTGEGYAIFGVYVGMDMDEAIATLTAAGLARTDNILGASFQHYASSNSPVNVQGFDSFINLLADANNKVSEISWSVYSGDWATGN